jgi:hypothetical protein
VRRIDYRNVFQDGYALHIDRRRAFQHDPAVAGVQAAELVALVEQVGGQLVLSVQWAELVEWMVVVLAWSAMVQMGA